MCFDNEDEIFSGVCLFVSCPIPVPYSATLSAWFVFSDWVFCFSLFFFGARNICSRVKLVSSPKLTLLIKEAESRNFSRCLSRRRRRVFISVFTVLLSFFSRSNPRAQLVQASHNNIKETWNASISNSFWKFSECDRS